MAGYDLRAWRISRANILVFAIFSLPILLLAGCSVFGSPNASTPSIKLSVLPASASLKPRNTQQFTVSVTGTFNTRVTWSATGGTVSASGVYTAPTTPGSYVVTATSNADKAVSASAAVTVNAGISISISPASASILVNGRRQFTATVSGVSNTAVTWSASGGSVSSSGLYTAPSTPGTYTVTVTSASDNTTSASATVTVNPVPVVAVTISPISAAILTSGKQQFTATVTGSSNTAVTWSATGGSVSSSGLYTAPATAGSFTVKATSVADTTKSAAATVTVTAPVVAIAISPTSASMATGGTQQFTATVTGSSNTAVTWSATGGSVSSSGLYTAPATAGSFTVKATSVADTTKSATATVTVSTAVQHTVTLNWTASSSSVSGYNVYRGTASGGPYTRINTALEAATNYVDNTVHSGTTYYYVVTAEASSGVESSFSNQVTAVVPSP